MRYTSIVNRNRHHVCHNAQLLLNEEQRREQPLAGSLFAIHGLGVGGLPPARFAG